MLFGSETGCFDHGTDSTRLSGSGPIQACNEFQVFPDIEIEIERIVFRQVAHASAYFQRFVDNIEAANGRPSGSGRKVAGQDLHHRRFTGTVRAQESDHVSFRYFETHGIQRQLFAVSFADGLYTDRHCPQR